jgi:hypothetical protein
VRLASSEACQALRSRVAWRDDWSSKSAAVVSGELEGDDAPEGCVSVVPEFIDGMLLVPAGDEVELDEMMAGGWACTTAGGFAWSFITTTVDAG